MYSVFKYFGYLEMLPKLPSVFQYSVFGFFGSVFGHDHIDQKEKMRHHIYFDFRFQIAQVYQNHYWTVRAFQAFQFAGHWIVRAGTKSYRCTSSSRKATQADHKTKYSRQSWLPLLCRKRAGRCGCCGEHDRYLQASPTC